MNLHHFTACQPCIARHIGPALAAIAMQPPRAPEHCGGCGQTVELWQFSYWFPVPTEVEA